MAADLKNLLAPISRLVSGLDLSDASVAERALNAAVPPNSAQAKALTDAASQALASGAICDRGEPGVRFSRVVKPQDDAAGCSIDAVHMTEAAGPPHTHTKGEVVFCVPTGGSPTFEGRKATWIVMPSGSRHVPEVKGGSMLMIYWWPQGAVAWG